MNNNHDIQMKQSLAEQLLAGDFIEKNRIWFSRTKDVAQTVWDTLAKENPTNAAVSSTNEASAKRKTAKEIERLAAELHDGIVLDLGCGYGRIAQYLLPKRNFSGYIGVDSSVEMLTLFRDRYSRTPEEQSTPALFLCSAIDVIPLKDQSVDNVIVSAVFLHNHKSVTERSLKEIKRILKKNGRLEVIGSFPNACSANGLQGFFYHLALNMFGDPFRNGPVRFFTKGEIQKYLKNFQTVKMIPTGFVVLPPGLVFLPRVINDPYCRFVAKPLNAVFEKIVPLPVKNIFCTHYDVVAKK